MDSVGFDFDFSSWIILLFWFKSDRKLIGTLRLKEKKEIIDEFLNQSESLVAKTRSNFCEVY